MTLSFFYDLDTGNMEISQKTVRYKAMPDNHITLGVQGEDFAIQHLKKKGYSIVERNVRFHFGELDIVAREKDGTLVFIEVKTLAEGASTEVIFSTELKPEDHMTAAKIQKFRRVAEGYANSHERLIDPQRGYRLDLIAITKTSDGFSIVHYENVC